MISEYIASKDCWTLEEVLEHTRKLLRDKCVVTIRELGKGATNNGGVLRVTGTRNKELTDK